MEDSPFGTKDDDRKAEDVDLIAWVVSCVLASLLVIVGVLFLLSLFIPGTVPIGNC